MSDDENKKPSFAYQIGYMFLPFGLLGILAVGVTAFIGGILAGTGTDEQLDYTGAALLLLVSAISFGLVVVVLGGKR